MQLWDLNSGGSVRPLISIACAIMHSCIFTLGQLRGSYLGHNHLDELESSNCVAFNPHGDKIYAGSNRMIKQVTYLCLRQCVFYLS